MESAINMNIFKSKNPIIISFASGEPYTSEAKNLEILSEKAGIEFHLYNWDWLIETKFYKDNKKLLDSKKSGYCAWKPYIILDALKAHSKVLYVDSSTLFVPSTVKSYIKDNKGTNSTATFLQNKYFTNKRCFRIMNCENDKYLEGYQLWAGNVLVDKSLIPMLEEWGKYCLIEDCVSDRYDEDNDEEFIYNTYDQSILGILGVKYSIKGNNNSYNGTPLFFDLREPSHEKAINIYFGENPIKENRKLLKKYFENYKFNRTGYVEQIYTMMAETV